MGQRIGAALSAQALDVAGHQLVVLGVGSQRQAGLLYLLQSPHKLRVVGAGQALELRVAALGSLVQEGLIGHHALLGQGHDLLGELAAGRAVEAVVYAAALLAQVQTVM